MFEEATIDLEVIDTQPVPSLRRSATPTVDERPAERQFSPPHAPPGAVLRLSDGSDSASDELRVELARLVQLLTTARRARDARLASEQAVEFLFGRGLRLNEDERRLLGSALTSARRRFGRMSLAR